ncbi:MAG TPA: hypothetical protein VFU59_07700 [Candidatus Eisenbacteria bacterium]|nr:hypothetical protein [Candidatus Eisenbacteria bacterium]
MSATTHAGPASPARLRRILVVVLIVCGLLGVAGYYYGGWLLKHPPEPKEVRPGH